MLRATEGYAAGTDKEQVSSAGQILIAAVMFVWWMVEHAAKMPSATIFLVAQAARAAVMVARLQEASAASWRQLVTNTP